jgi:hypothetical protein
MVSCKVGHIYIVNTVLTKPPKEKYALCICVGPDYFFWINTDPRRHGRDQLALKKGCHNLVTHDSFLDLSRIVAHSAAELENAREFARISPELTGSILKTLENGLYILPPQHADLVKMNLQQMLDGG